MFGKCIENKIDLEDKSEILKEEGLKKAENSSKTGENVEQIFEFLTRSILKVESYS